MPAVCAIDFGTSNSAIALPMKSGGVRLVDLENGQPTMPTAVFYAVEGLAAFEEPHLHFGRAAVAAYVEGIEGRLMRSMKSILGSTLADQATDVGGGRSVRYLDVVGAYLRHLKATAEREAGRAPVHHAAERHPVALAEGGDAEQVAEGVVRHGARALARDAAKGQRSAAAPDRPHGVSPPRAFSAR